MTTISITGLTRHLDFSDLSRVFKDAGKTQVATAEGDIVLTTTSVVGGADNPKAGTGDIKVGKIGGKFALLFPGTAYLTMNDIAGTLTGQDVPYTAHLVCYVPTAASGTTHRAFRALGSGNSEEVLRIISGSVTVLDKRASTGEALKNVSFGSTVSDQRLVFTIINNGVTVDGFFNGNRVLTAAARDSASLLTMTQFLLGATLTGLIGEFAYYANLAVPLSTAETDHNVLRASWPQVAAVPMIAITGADLRRGISSARPTYAVMGSLANITGTPASLWARVKMQSDDSTLKAFANTGATFNGLAFTGGSIAAIPAGGPYLIEYQVRDSGGAVLHTINNNVSILVGKVILAVGSSSPEHFGDEGTGAASDKMMLFNANTGSTWRTNDTLGAGYHALHEAQFARTGQPTIVINAAIGGTVLANWAGDQDVAAGGAVTAARPFQLAVNSVANADTWLDGAIMGAGANDSFKPYEVSAASSVRSRQSHQAKLETLRAKIIAISGQADIPIVIAGINNRLNDDTNSANADGDRRPTMSRGAEVAMCRTRANMRYVSSMDLPLAPADIHLTDSGNVTMGGRLDAAFASVVAGTRYHPRFESAAFVSDGAELTLLHSSGTDIAVTPAGGFAGFRVYDELGALVALSGDVVRLAANKVKVPFVYNSAKAYIVQHQPGTRSTPLGSLLKDSNGSPVQPTITGVGQVLLSDGTRVTVTN